ncbi:MAG: sigma-70 family RNA polymerase sigma factor [Nocardioidaceae bacterium]
MGMQHTQTTAGATSKEDGVDPDAVARFAAAEEQRLLRYAYLVSRSSDDARDLVQTAFAGMLSVSSRISDPSSYARRIILNEVRRQSRRRVSLLAPTTTMHEGHEADLVEQDAMWRALGTLPARQRAVLVLRYYETLDDQTIATVLKCRRSTVRSLAARGLRALKRTQEIDVAGLESEGSRG